MCSLYPIRLPVFEGPLDLLLRLIEREELDITSVALAQVTDQYLARLERLSGRPVKELAEFLFVAAKLLLIKSQALLPGASTSSAEGEAQCAGEELVRQLRIYKQFKDIAALLHEREQRGLRSYVRIAHPPRPDPELDLGEVTLGDLLNAAQEALEVTPGRPVGEVVAPITVTISQQIGHIEDRLAQERQVRFRQILSHASSRIEIIVTLLALLELIKQDKVYVRQDRLFGEIIIKRRTVGGPRPVDTAATSPAA